MYAVVDSSTLISMAWAGALDLATAARRPVDLMVPAEVRHETVDRGLERGYPDASAIAEAITDAPTAEPVHAETVDQAVLAVARLHGVLVSNDVALGRRATNVGVRWLRTADWVLLCLGTGRIPRERALAVLHGLHEAGQLTDELLTDYLEEL